MSDAEEARADALAKGYPICDLEQERLDLLRDLEVLDSDGDRAFDQMTQLACLVFDCPIALVSMMDTNRQWFLSHTGLAVKETPRELAFCNHPIAEAANGRKQWPFVVWNAEEDERFSSNALVTGFPDIRFYAGVPLVLDKSRNLAVGTLCLLDNTPRNETSFTSGDQEKLAAMADVVVDILVGLKKRQSISRKLQRQTMINMGHQMLNPLHALRDVTSLIRKEENIQPALLQGLEHSVDQLTSAIESAATMDVLSELQAKFTPTLFSPADVLRDLVNFYAPLVPRVRIEITNKLDVDGQVNRVRMQRTKFAKCIGHLFSIALRGVADVTEHAELDPAVAVAQRMKTSKAHMRLMVTLDLDPETKELKVSLFFNTGALPHVRLSSKGFSFVDSHLFVANKLAEQLGGKLETPTANDIVFGETKGDADAPEANTREAPCSIDASAVSAAAASKTATSSLGASLPTTSTRDPADIVCMSLRVPDPLVTSPSLDPVDFVPAMRKLADTVDSVSSEAGEISSLESCTSDDACETQICGHKHMCKTADVNKIAKLPRHDGICCEMQLKPAHGVTAYIVDDEPVNRMIMSRMLSKAGFQRRNIIAFADGDQVPLSLASGHKAEPDVCFVDIVMHRLNGDELCTRMRAAGWTCPIVAVTGNAIEEARLREIGFDEVVRKPFDASVIVRSLVSTARIEVCDVVL
ncbi:Histidine kinase 3 [Hondaea fermentalgiana]|uniref:Histidine kinase 3 n=1 Tax=Hondaea fermentalgiana TaxID=2315210 RepID=A0A2R5GV55_9STRA|nr:Histidine kinase 3 [Hondaea fermentalgiana]|eukprot:GBG34445.1 Histidine kinase 3 [Hondaea fermentalgiana]